MARFEWSTTQSSHWSCWIFCHLLSLRVYFSSFILCLVCLIPRFAVFWSLIPPLSFQTLPLDCWCDGRLKSRVGICAWKLPELHHSRFEPEQPFWTPSSTKVSAFHLQPSELLKTFCQQLFSQFSRFSPCDFNLKFTTIFLLPWNGEMDWMVVQPNNKRGHVFEAWIRLMQNEFQTYMYFFCRYFRPDEGVSSGSKLCLTLVEYIDLKTGAYQGTSWLIAFFWFCIGWRYRLDMIGHLTF